jgi:AcrR family transcriptional regulator
MLDLHMPRLTPETQAARREHILDAAEHCFARNGFHGSSIQDICREAEVSPGALYVYFTSKEHLISGIAERDRLKLQGEIEEVARADDLLGALERLGDHYMHHEPAHKRALCIEIGAEATRNPVVGEMYRRTHAAVHQSFVSLFERASREGKIAPRIDIETLAHVLQIIGDGLFWRRAVDPAFDPETVTPTLMALIHGLTNPVTAATDNSGLTQEVRS